MTDSTKNLIIPNKVNWIVDLRQTEQNILPKKVMQRILHDDYETNVRMDILDANNIPKLFYPLYSKLMMDREDFRLSKTETYQKISNLSNNPEYKLLWFCDKHDMEALGGIVIHLLGDKFAVAYRCFNHNTATIYGLREIDYFAELKMREYAKSLNYNLLSHGHDKHPVNQVGLSIWKFRIGAKPAFSHSATTDNYSENDLVELSRDSGVSGYYSNPANELYTKFHLFGNSETELVKSFVKVAAASGVEVIVHQ